MNYMFYLRSKISSQHSNPSQNTSPYLFAFKFKVKFVNLSRRDPHLDDTKFEFSNLTHRLELVCFFVKGKRLNYALLAALKKSASNSNKCSAAKYKASVTAPSCLQASLAERSIGIERSQKESF